MTKETSKDVRAAETTEDKAGAAQEQAPKKEQAAAKAPVYSAGEFAANAKKIFGTSQECVLAALRAAGKMECTVPEAKEIVKKFLNKEVR